jgi:hypothetical protein
MCSGDGSECHADDELGGSFGRAAACCDDLVPSGKAGGGYQQVGGVAPAQACCERVGVTETLDQVFHDLYPAGLKLVDYRQSVCLGAGQGKDRVAGRGGAGEHG